MVVYQDTHLTKHSRSYIGNPLHISLLHSFLLSFIFFLLNFCTDTHTFLDILIPWIMDPRTSNTNSLFFFTASILIAFFSFHSGHLSALGRVSPLSLSLSLSLTCFLSFYYILSSNPFIGYILFTFFLYCVYFVPLASQCDLDIDCNGHSSSSVLDSIAWLGDDDGVAEDGAWDA
jgi:hypothetical protein